VNECMPLLRGAEVQLNDWRERHAEVKRELERRGRLLEEAAAAHRAAAAAGPGACQCWMHHTLAASCAHSPHLPPWLNLTDGS